MKEKEHVMKIHIIFISLISYNLFGASSEIKVSGRDAKGAIRIEKDLLIQGVDLVNKSYFEIIKRVSTFHKLEESIDLLDIELQRAFVHFHIINEDPKSRYFIKIVSNKTPIEVLSLESKETVIKKDFLGGYYDFQIILFDMLSKKEIHRKIFSVGVLNDQKLIKSFQIRDGKLNMREET
jgi:hypothetical protein